MIGNFQVLGLTDPRGWTKDRNPVQPDLTQLRIPVGEPSTTQILDLKEAHQTYPQYVPIRPIFASLSSTLSLPRKNGILLTNPDARCVHYLEVEILNERFTVCWTRLNRKRLNAYFLELFDQVCSVRTYTGIEYVYIYS